MPMTSNRRRMEAFNISKAKHLAAKLEDIVGLYLPEHAIVMCVDQKSQIQALDAPNQACRSKKGLCGTMPYNYKRNETAMVSAALKVVIPR